MSLRKLEILLEQSIFNKGESLRLHHVYPIKKESLRKGLGKKLCKILYDASLNSCINNYDSFKHVRSLELSSYNNNEKKFV